MYYFFQKSKNTTSAWASKKYIINYLLLDKTIWRNNIVKGSRATMVFIHGGGWTEGTADEWDAASLGI